MEENEATAGAEATSSEPPPAEGEASATAETESAASAEGDSVNAADAARAHGGRGTRHRWRSIPCARRPHANSPSSLRSALRSR